jgi:hypothetical protein
VPRRQTATVFDTLLCIGGESGYFETHFLLAAPHSTCERLRESGGRNAAGTASVAPPGDSGGRSQ